LGIGDVVQFPVHKDIGARDVGKTLTAVVVNKKGIVFIYNLS
jgi:hypothetical protein